MVSGLFFLIIAISITLLVIGVWKKNKIVKILGTIGLVVCFLGLILLWQSLKAM